MLFDNVEEWLKWKSDPFNILERKYGKEFADWARHNKDNVLDKWINLGCKNAVEYNNQIVKRQGYYDRAEYLREWRHDNNINSPMSENEIVHLIKECARLANSTWNFAILNNDNADYFVLIGFNHPEDEKDLKLLRIWLFKKDDMVVKRIGGRGHIMEKFYRRSSISIVNRSKDIIMFQKYEWTDKLNLDLM